MTQKANTNNERAYGALWFENDKSGAPQTLSVRVLHNDVSEFLQTSTHWVFFEKKAGGRGNIRVECNKKGSFGATREAIQCPLDAGEKYGAPKNKQWFWVEDQTDGGLKYVEMPYSIRQQLEVLQTSAFRGAPLMNAKLQFIKSGKGLNTQYQVVPDMGSPIADFDLAGYLANLNLQNLPPLVGTENFPPIWSLDDEGLENASRGIMPWQGGGKTGPGTPEQNVAAYNPYGNPEPLTPQEPQAQAPAQAAAPQAPAQAPVQDLKAPVLEAVPSDDLPETLNPTAPAIPNEPYNDKGEQEEDELEGKKVFF